jgi:apurinic endonuclease APN1
MLIGAHVSPAGGLPKAIERGLERGCRAIQIFNQSPRMWKPTRYSDEDVDAFKEAMAASPIDAVLIHAVYLLNCASTDREIRSKSLASLTHSLRVGEAIGAHAVVLHSGSAKSGEVSRAITRAGKTIRAALEDSEGCPLHLENTAGTGGTLGRSISELARLLDAAGGDGRLGLCLDSCHLFASGYDIRTAEGMDATLADLDAIGWARCTSTTRSPRWARRETATPTSAVASSARRDARPSCPRRRWRGSRACSRPPARNAAAPLARKCSWRCGCARWGWRRGGSGSGRRDRSGDDRRERMFQLGP